MSVGSAHAPAVQTVPQTRPQPPQLARLVSRFASQPSVPPLQSENPTSQITPQRLDAHAGTEFARAGHTVEHAPQLAGSVVVFVQNAPAPAPHVVRGAAHVGRHMPLEQTVPAPQGTPQPPQFALSMAVLASQPFVALPSQFAKPALHVPRPQRPVRQAAAALAKEQRTPHPPQLLMSAARVLSSQPLLARPSQSPKPVAHAPTTQAELAQACTVTLVSEHALMHAPQLFTSVVVRTQSPAQFVVPAPQVAAQAPAEHT
jgi:hypothetical protein